MVKDMLLQEVTADRIIGVASDQVMMAAREVLRRIPSFQEATVKWLNQYQKGRFEVYVDTSSLAMIIATIMVLRLVWQWLRGSSADDD